MLETICVSTYVPTGPYVIKSGIRKGKSLEELMFKNYSWLCEELKIIESKLKEGSKPNDMHGHLRWLLCQGETRKSELLCPFCHENRIKLFSYSYKERKYFTSCDAPDVLCKYNLFPKDQRHPLKFSSILNFSTSSQSFVGAFLKTVFFPNQKDLSIEKLFKFFADQSPA